MLAKNFQRHDAAAGAAGTQFTCFPSTKVQILTQKLAGRGELPGRGWRQGGGGTDEYVSRDDGGRLY